MTLPTHAETRAPVVIEKLESMTAKIARPSSPAQYQAADRKLFRLEEELHFLIQCSRIVWGQRADFAEKHLDSSGDVDVNVNAPDHEGDIIDGYLDLAEKSRKLDDEIKKLKEKCSTARNECNFHFVFQNDSFEGSNYKGHTRSIRKWLRLHEMDSYGAMEKETAVEPIFDTASTVINVAAAVGTVAASLAYATLFSTTRGRLDLIAWSFVCFFSAVSICAFLQGLQRSRRIMVKTLTSMSVSLVLKHTFNGLFIIDVLLTAGTALLAVSIALLNKSESAEVDTVGSRIAISVAGYVSLGWTCLHLVLVWIWVKNRKTPARKGQPPSQPMTADEQKRKNLKILWPSHLLSVESKWDYMPGEKGYSDYRQSRRSFALNLPEQ